MSLAYLRAVGTPGLVRTSSRLSCGLANAKLYPLHATSSDSITGTTAIKAWIYDAANGAPLAGIAARRAAPGWAEHDPGLLWDAAASVYSASRWRALEHARSAGLAVASMGEPSVPLDERGDPLYPIIAYYDPRALNLCGPGGAHPRPPRAARDQRPGAAAGLRRDEAALATRRPPRAIRPHTPLALFGDYLIWRLAGVAAYDH